MVGTALTSRDPNLWTQTTGIDDLWNGVGNRQTPTIAIIDSGIDSRKLDFSGGVVNQVNLSSLDPLAHGDQFGHGTMVAGLAAGVRDPAGRTTIPVLRLNRTSSRSARPTRTTNRWSPT
jgi:subtilisin family serine protease